MESDKGKQRVRFISKKRRNNGNKYKKEIRQRDELS